jgi:hypothetical protein
MGGLPEPDIGEIVGAQRPVMESLSMLVDKANATSGQDNITAVLYEHGNSGNRKSSGKPSLIFLQFHPQKFLGLPADRDRMTRFTLLKLLDAYSRRTASAFLLLACFATPACLARGSTPRAWYGCDGQCHGREGAWVRASQPLRVHGLTVFASRHFLTTLTLSGRPKPHSIRL